MPVVIVRDTGSIQTLMVGDPKSLPSESNTWKSVSDRDVNGGTRSVPLYKVNLLADVVSGEVVVGVVPSLPMKGISFLLGNGVAGGRVKVSPIVSKSEENQTRDEECHKVRSSENAKVRDNPNFRPSRLSESKRSCDVNEGQGKVELDEAKGERGKATRTSGHRVGQGHFVPRDAKVQAIVDFPSPSTNRERA